MSKESLVAQARASFDHVLRHDVYAGIIRDDEHLSQLLALANVQPGDRILDVGTGTGYLAFPLAQAHPDCTVTGLDITPGAIEANRSRAAALGLSHLRFDLYDGLRYPYPDGHFDLIVTRYALHHFPDLTAAAADMARVLSPGGRVLIADPMRHPEDKERLIDRFMALKQDGHVAFRTVEELDRIFARCGLIRRETLMTRMRFPFPPRPEYDALLEQIPPDQRALYALSRDEKCVRVGDIAVGNLLYVKEG